MKDRIEQAIVLLPLAAVVAGLVSIAASHILLGLSVAALAWRRDRLRLPPVWVPLALFCGWTLLSAAFSSHPAAAWPQLRKFYVFLFLVIVYSGLRRVKHAQWMLYGVIAAACASALWGVVQFAVKYQRAAAAGQDFYQSYIASRITGFMSHWMTFGAHMMAGLVLLAALVFFARAGVKPALWLAPGALLSLALTLGLTRNVWAASAAGLVYLLWCWRRWLVALVPVAGGLVFLAAPEPVQSRIRSAWQPNAQLDSNQHRTALRRTGFEMIKAHPLLGIGPEQVGPRFLEFAPADIPRPVPISWYTGHLHNIYLQYAAVSGLPALAFLLWFFGGALFSFHARIRTLAPEETARRFILHGVTACLVGVLTGGMWEHNLGDSEVLGLTMSLIGAGYAATGEEA